MKLFAKLIISIEMILQYRIMLDMKAKIAVMNTKFGITINPLHFENHILD